MPTPRHATPRHATPRHATALLWWTSIFSLGCVDWSSTSGEHVSRPEIKAEQNVAAFPLKHPLSGAVDSFGKVLSLQAKDAIDGRRYAIEESYSAPISGSPSIASGIVRHRVGALTEVEKQAISLAKSGDDSNFKPNALIPTSLSSSGKFGASLDQRLRDAGPDTRFFVTAWLSADLPEESLQTALELEIGSGLIQTREQFRDRRATLLHTRAEMIATAQESALTLLIPDKTDILWRYRNIPALDLEITAEALRNASSNPRFQAFDLIPVNEEGAVSGTEIVAGTQLEQFINYFYDGYNTWPQFWARWAVIELGGANYGHVGFLDDGDWPPTSRIILPMDCSGSGITASCSQGTWSTYSNDHATAVAGIVAGDLRDDQDSKVITQSNQIARSGYAGESQGYIYRANYGPARYDRVMAAYDDIIALDVWVSNQSNGSPANSSSADDPNCTGRTNFSRTANAVFEAGILPFVLAGNNGFHATDCRLWSPSPALGVFTVGSHGANAGTESETTVRSGAISSFSSVGLAGRTMVDATAYGCRTHTFTSAGGYNTGSICGTSYATPTVVGAALDFMTFYEDTFSTWIENPGALMANLLLMTDRQGQTGLKNTYFDRLWGGGRLKMRKWNTTGLDNPAHFATGSVCVDQGQTVVLSVNGGQALSTDVDYIKAVIYWYDERHDNSSGPQLDDIDLHIRNLTTNSIMRSSWSGSDNKERVFYSDVGGLSVDLEIHGYNVTNDNSGCGQNSMRVYYAWLYEDNDRNDSTGMDGIDPEY